MSIYETADESGGGGGGGDSLVIPDYGGTDDAPKKAEGFGDDGGGAGLMAAGKGYALTVERQKLGIAGGCVLLVAAIIYLVSGASAGTPHGRFVAINSPMHWDDAKTYCEDHFAGLASIHTKEEQKQADEACLEMPLSRTWADENGTPHACWIGMFEDHTVGAFKWSDSSPVSYLNFQAGEPNNDNRIDDAGHEEDKVEINFAGWGGAWNDNHAEGAAGFAAHASSCSDGSCDSNAYGNYPLCEVSAPAPSQGATQFVPPTRVNSVDGSRFFALPGAYSLDDADAQCRQNGGTGLASIHSVDEQRSAAMVCEGLVSKEWESGVPHGCWIGYHRISRGAQAFSWLDGTVVNYMNWSPGEPNDYHADSGSSFEIGEEAVEMDFRSNGLRQGGWDDNNVNGEAGHGAFDPTTEWGVNGIYGAYPLCQTSVPQQHTLANNQGGSLVGVHDTTPHIMGRFAAIQSAHDYDSARQVCVDHGFLGLASIHQGEQATAAQACSQIVNSDMNSGAPKGCWIGFHRTQTGGNLFVWEDGSPADFFNWAPGEPNDYHADGGTYSQTHGEEVVEMDFRSGANRGGGWNDQNKQGEAGHGSTSTETGGYFGTEGAFGAYVLCQTQCPPGTMRQGQTNQCTRYGSSQGVNSGNGLHNSGFEVRNPVTSSDGKYTAFQHAMSWDDAQNYCISHNMAGLASLHSHADQLSAAGACSQLTSDDAGRIGAEVSGIPHGCWIGFNARMVGTTAMPTWTWNDHTPVTFVNWSPGEPNDYRSSASGAASTLEGEDVAEMDFRDANAAGGWNDNHATGQAGHGESIDLFGHSTTVSEPQNCFGCSGVYGQYILCESTIPVVQSTCTGASCNGGAGAGNSWVSTGNEDLTSNLFAVSPAPKSWLDARAYCQEHYFDLASIHNDAESQSAYNLCKRLHKNGMSGQPSGCWIGLNSIDISGQQQHGTFRWSDMSPVEYTDWSPGEPNDWGQQSNVGAASTEGEDSVELNIDRLGQWNDQHGDGMSAHNQVSLFGSTVDCFGCSSAFGMWPLCRRHGPAPSVVNSQGNVFDPVTHMVVTSTEWHVPGSVGSNLNHDNNDYFGTTTGSATQHNSCFSGKSCAQLQSEFAARGDQGAGHALWSTRAATSSAHTNGDSMVCGESRGLDGVDASCNGGLNGVQNGMTAGGSDSASRGWEHANTMCESLGARLCTVREMILDSTAGSGCQHDGELVWTSEGCAPSNEIGVAFVAAPSATAQYHLVAQGGSHRGAEACPDQCGGLGEGCTCTPRCAANSHNVGGLSFAHRCCADVSPSTVSQAVGGVSGCASMTHYDGLMMAPPSTYGAAAGGHAATGQQGQQMECLFGTCVAAAGTTPAPPPSSDGSIRNPFLPPPPSPPSPFSPPPPPSGSSGAGCTGFELFGDCVENGQAPPPPGGVCTGTELFGDCVQSGQAPPPPGGCSGLELFGDCVASGQGATGAACTAPFPFVTGGHFTLRAGSNPPSASLTCNTGYVLSTPFASPIMCTNNQWSANTVHCTLPNNGAASSSTTCATQVPVVQNGVYHQATYQAMTATLTCNHGYSVSTPFASPISCSGGRWSTGSATCVPTAQQPLPPPPPTVNTCTAQLPFVTGGSYTRANNGGLTATLSCNQGYVLSTPFPSPITCSNNRWSTGTATCNQAQQSPPPPPAQAQCTTPVPFVAGGIYTQATVGATTATLSCNQGYTLSSAFGATQITCTNNRWSAGTTTCVSLSLPPPPPPAQSGCGNLPFVTGGAWSAAGFTQGSSAQLACNQGYQATPAFASIQCNLGQWTASTAQCLQQCTTPVPVVVGGFYTQASFGAPTATLTCNQGYSPPPTSPFGPNAGGASTITCTGGYWTNPAPQCTQNVG